MAPTLGLALGMVLPVGVLLFGSSWGVTGLFSLVFGLSYACLSQLHICIVGKSVIVAFRLAGVLPFLAGVCCFFLGLAR